MTDAGHGSSLTPVTGSTRFDFWVALLRALTTAFSFLLAILTPPKAGPKTALWLLPIGFIFHDGEELLTMVSWMERHRAELERWSSQSPMLSRLIETVPSTRTEVTVTMAVELALLLAVTGIAARDVHQRIPLYAYSAMLGVFVFHAGTHALQAVIFGGYVPGVVTAATIIPIVGIVTYRALLRGELLSVNAAVITAIVGAAVFVPLFAPFVRVARSIDAAL